MAVSITLQNARTTIEKAICDYLAWAYGRRLFTVADIATLRAKASAGIPDRAMCNVTTGGTPQTNGYAWMWQVGNYTADDGVNFVQPSDVAGGLPGRWCRVSATGANSQATTGYLIRAEPYNDDSADPEVFVQRLFDGVPAALLSFDGIQRQPKTTEPGAIDWCTAHFTLFAVSFDPRGGQSARQGSTVPAEAQDDPGTAAILGDAKAALKGVDLGIADVAYVRIEDEEPVVKDLAQSRFVDALKVTVYYTESLPDPTTVPLGDPYEFNLNFLLADVDGSGNLDTSNDVTSTGLQFALGDGLNKSFSGGTMNFNGANLNVPGGSHTFQASSVTYRDVDATGAIYYMTTNFGDAPPPVAFGRVRLGVTFSDSTGVRLDRLLAAQLIQIGPTDKVAPPQVTALTLSPPTPSFPAGTPFQFTVLATRADGSSGEDVTNLVTWVTDDSGDTQFTPSGIATKAHAGTAHITATLNGVVSNTATLTAT